MSMFTVIGKNDELLSLDSGCDFSGPARARIMVRGKWEWIAVASEGGRSRRTK